MEGKTRESMLFKYFDENWFFMKKIGTDVLYFSRQDVCMAQI